MYNNAFKFEKGMFPVAERIQPRMMQFKTNYRNIEVAQEQAKILKKTIKEVNNR